eukprot:TRINITY_DN1700_c1_g1_i2.p1 TRINITY_DN1700_c1_g1~~TRINITY_DN1700_c1_g1_i2.p1  ORF type:complete len:451 (+),score=102.23 TRINITY_DN1700_c1_g1_i2:29-1381(+)
MTAVNPKLKLIQSLANDVTALKKEVVDQNTRVESIATFLKENFKPTLEQLKMKFGEDLSELRDLLESNAKKTSNITNWIKENLGTKLELVNTMVNTEISTQLDARLKTISDEQKTHDSDMWTTFKLKYEQLEKLVDKQRVDSLEREEGMWKVFKAHYKEQEESIEQYVAAVSDEKNSTTKELNLFKKALLDDHNKMRADFDKIMKDMEEEKQKLVNLREEFEKSYETLMVEAKQRPQAEAEMFQRLTKRLEQELQLISMERQKLEESRRKEKRTNSLKQVPEVNSCDPVVLTDSGNKQPTTSSTTTTTTTTMTNKNPVFVNIDGKQAVAQWLESNGLSELFDKFILCGYESMEIVSLIDESDLDAMDIVKQGHRKSLQQALQKLKFETNKELSKEGLTSNDKFLNFDDRPRRSSSFGSPFSSPYSSAKSSKKSERADSDIDNISDEDIFA